jgi:hypothetical protein
MTSLTAAYEAAKSYLVFEYKALTVTARVALAAAFVLGYFLG